MSGVYLSSLELAITEDVVKAVASNIRPGAVAVRLPPESNAVDVLVTTSWLRQ